MSSKSSSRWRRAAMALVGGITVMAHLAMPSTPTAEAAPVSDRIAAGTTVAEHPVHRPADENPRGPSPPLPSPTGWPLSPVPQVLRGFDRPDEPWGSGNRGLDLAAADGAPVHAVAAGTVSFAGPVGGRGVVVVTHGEVRTTYTPVTASRSVGERVILGDRIGVVDGSHCPTRGCLHLGLLAGDDYLDPMLLFGPDARTVPSGPVRLLPEGAGDIARRRAAERARQGVPEARRDRTVPTGAHGFVMPTVGPISSGFGWRVHPVTGVRRLHDGTDIAARCGRPVASSYPGRVVAVTRHPALGLRVVIDHGTVDGHHVRTSLNHLSRQDVRAGARVSRGQVIGRVGSTGLSTGCHLHLMVRLDGRLIDPLTWF